MDAESLLKEVRDWLAPLNEKILKHPYIGEAEQGKLALDSIRTFVANQYYIVSHDVKSLALMLSRSTTREEADFFANVLNGDVEGLKLLVKLAEALGFTMQELEDYSPIPKAVAYTHYLAALASLASPGEQAFALIVNLPVWGSNCGRLSKALREKYGIDETGFLDIFTSPMEEAERAALQVMDGYLPASGDRMRRAAKLIQAYELMFWDGVYEK
ncbi:MAG: TenA family transcriptional regulator [Candidatus Bathyarchaeia archaeon]